MAFSIRVAAAFAIVTVVATAARGQATLHVDDDNCPGSGTGTQADPFCMIQDGMDAAVNGDEVVVAPGTYNELINFLGKAITVRSSDGADVTIIDGTGLNESVVQCVSGEGADTVLDGFTITGGTGSVCSTTVSCGGGMFNDNSAPTVTNCTFSGNATGRGGGMYNEFSAPTVANCTFTGNTGNIGGGGMFNTGFSSPTVTNCTFSGNTGGDVGGGMYNLGGSNPTVTNCTFAGNTTFELGGGMYNEAGSNPTVTNCTFSGNVAGIQGGGMVNIGSSPMVTNCILWGDSPQEIFISSSTLTISFSDVQGGWPGEGNIDVDPLLVDADGLDDVPGTEDDDLRLLPGSPVIDAGDNTALPTGVTIDLDGNPRFADDLATTDSGNGTPPIVDMGAYEFPSLCGNGVVDADEECDDGNIVSGDGCDNNCTVTACGNGIQTAGEECDGGLGCNNCLCDVDFEPTDPPSLDCQPTCGNGSVDPGEACDDGNQSDCDGCRANCSAVEGMCGDGTLDPVCEVCDDGNSVNGDGCDINCTFTACGNGIQTAGEECDDGNLDDGDLCSGQCLIEGACCDLSPGVEGSCTVTIQDACVGKQLIWHRGVLCSQPLCEGVLEATVSLKAVEVNGVPLRARTNTVTVAAGDTILAQIFISGWGDEINRVRIWQSGVLGQAGSTNGVSGTILPLGWPDTPDDGAFIEVGDVCTSGPNVGEPCTNSVRDCLAPDLCDCLNPEFIMCGFDLVICAVANVTLNYKYACLLFANVGAFDDGGDFYAGTLILEVSQDACGTFTFAMNDDPYDNFLTTPFPEQTIHPVTEDLVIEVECFTGTGACCDSGNGLPGAASCDRAVLEDCQCETCSWFGDTACADLKATGDCLVHPIPTVSEWGLVILTLLLLTGAKIYFGRRRVVTA